MTTALITSGHEAGSITSTPEVVRPTADQRTGGGGANIQISQRKIWKRHHLQIGLYCRELLPGQLSARSLNGRNAAISYPQMGSAPVVVVRRPTVVHPDAQHRAQLTSSGNSRTDVV